MVINYDMQKLNQALQDFYNATGINMDLLKEDFSYAGNRSHWENTRYCKAIQQTEAGKKLCLQSDQCLLAACKKSKKRELHICHAGLIDVSLPILYDDMIIGYLIFGQMKTNQEFSWLKPALQKLKLHTEEMKEYYHEIPVFDSDKIQSVSNIAEMLVKYILLENILKPDFDKKVQSAVAFIEQHLDQPLSIRTISKEIGISKSVLYERFHSCFQCTVSEYINIKRVEKSIELLTKTDLSIEEISQKTGFSSASYYSKMFKKIKQTTPLKYKKKIKGF